MGGAYGRSKDAFYVEQAGTADWVQIDFGFVAGNVVLINDAANAGDFSFSDEEGAAKPKQGEIRQNQQLIYNGMYTSTVYIKNTGAGAATFRIYAW